MDKNEKLRVQLAIDQADTWAKQYAKITQARNEVRTNAAVALKTLRGSIVPAVVNGETFNVLPLGAEQLTALGTFARFISMAPISGDDAELLHQLETELPRSIAEAGRGIASRRPSTDDLDAAEYVKDYASWGLSAGIADALTRITPPVAANSVNSALGKAGVDGNGSGVEPSFALAPQYGLANALKKYGTAELVPAETLRSRLATYNAAARTERQREAKPAQYAGLARSINPADSYVVVCSPAGRSAVDLISALETSSN